MVFNAVLNHCNTVIIIKILDVGMNANDTSCIVTKLAHLYKFRQ